MIQLHFLWTMFAGARQRLVAGSLALAVTGGTILGLPALGFAQNDGTGGPAQTSPGQCGIVVSTVDPALAANAGEPAGTPIGGQQSAASATPAASPVVDEDATPVASPVIDAATPIASPVAAREPVDPVAPLRDELLTTTETLFACLNESAFDTLAKLTSDAWRGQLFGSDQPLPADLFIGLAASLPDIEYGVIELNAVVVIDATTVSSEVTYRSAYQQHTGVWTFSRQTVDGLVTWVLESEQRIAVPTPTGTSTIDVVFQDNGYQVTPSAVIGSDVVLNLSNPTSEDHEALILRFDDGVTTGALLQNTSATLPEGVTLVGQSTVLAGGEGAMYLTGLEPGVYTIVDLFPDENGNPHLSSGMVATFTVLF